MNGGKWDMEQEQKKLTENVDVSRVFDAIYDDIHKQRQKEDAEKEIVTAYYRGLRKGLEFAAGMLISGEYDREQDSAPAERTWLTVYDVARMIVAGTEFAVSDTKNCIWMCDDKAGVWERVPEQIRDARILNIRTEGGRLHVRAEVKVND